MQYSKKTVLSTFLHADPRSCRRVIHPLITFPCDPFQENPQNTFQYHVASHYSNPSLLSQIFPQILLKVLPFLPNDFLLSVSFFIFFIDMCYIFHNFPLTFPMQISFSHLTRIRFHSLQIFSYFNIRNNIPFCRPSMHSIIFFQCPSENAYQGCCIERNTRKSFHIPSSPGLAKTYHKNLSYKLSANPT